MIAQYRWNMLLLFDMDYREFEYVKPIEYPLSG